MPEYAIAVAQQKARCRLPGEGFSELLLGPLRRGMGSDCHVKDPTTFVRQHHENIEDLEADGEP
jgi:hypothetical protein